MTFFPKPAGDELSRNGRVLLGLWSLCLIGGFTVAWSLEPDPQGFGTHQRLGLPPCSFRELTGRLCPGCGLTTSISYFVRGRFVDSARSNVAGLCLAVACALQVPWAWHAIWTGRPWLFRHPDTVAIAVLGLVTIVAGVQWIVRLVLGP